MAFFTIFAEGIFVLALVKVLDQFKTSTPKKTRTIIPVIFFLLLFILLFFGEDISGLIVRYDRGYNLLTYRVIVWDLLATLYALLEGIICLLAARVYQQLKGGLSNNTMNSQDNPEISRPIYHIGMMTAAFTIVFCLFEYSAITVAVNNRLSSSGILSMARFYRIIMGWLWTAFEVILAVILIRILYSFPSELRKSG
ncbi:MAG: hypothetical protein JW932_12330 [Deltaproteobacteria bacterium]|nr:hypothetical protein [Deltaproteobacteria bacterium]